jgi:hypothetical protein
MAMIVATPEPTGQPGSSEYSEEMAPVGDSSRVESLRSGSSESEEME